MRRVVNDQVYASTSTHGIAKRAGVGVGTLYEYFDSKEDLLAALLEHEVEMIWQQLESQIPKWMNRTNADPVESFVGFVVEYASQNKGMVRVMFGQLPDLMYGPSMIRLRGRLESLVSMLLLNQRVGDSKRHPVDVFIFTNAMIGLVLGIVDGLPSAISEQDLTVRLTETLKLVR